MRRRTMHTHRANEFYFWRQTKSCCQFHFPYWQFHWLDEGDEGAHQFVCNSILFKIQMIIFRISRRFHSSSLLEVKMNLKKKQIQSMNGECWWCKDVRVTIKMSYLILCWNFSEWNRHSVAWDDDISKTTIRLFRVQFAHYIWCLMWLCKILYFSQFKSHTYDDQRYNDAFNALFCRIIFLSDHRKTHLAFK